MTLTPADRDAVIGIRMQNASMALDDSRVLLARGSLRGAANRLYYAAFHALSALALARGKVIKTHRGIIGFFFSDCVESGLVDARLGRAVQKAFEERFEADYEDDVSFEASGLESRITEVVEVVSAVRRLVETCGPR